MDSSIEKADEAFREIFHHFDLFDYLNPINGAEEKTKFFESREAGEEYNPEYEYKPLPRNFSARCEKLESLSFGTGALARAYEDTRNEYLLTFAMLAARGRPEFTNLCVRIFGLPSDELVSTCRKDLKLPRKGAPAEFEEVGVKRVIERFRDRLREDQIEGWDVVEDPSAVTLAYVDSSRHKIRLQTGIVLTDGMVDRLLHHQIGVHVYRSMNGERQPSKIFGVGLDRYRVAEEGLALELEERMGLQTMNVKRRYAGRGWASALAMERSFFDIFEDLVEFFPEEEAFALTQRSKRGILDTSQPGGFIQDHIYLQGKTDVKSLTNEDIKLLFTGKIGIHHLPLVREMMKRDELLEPAFLPRAFHG